MRLDNSINTHSRQTTKLTDKSCHHHLNYFHFVSSCECVCASTLKFIVDLINSIHSIVIRKSPAFHKLQSSRLFRQSDRSNTACCVRLITAVRSHTGTHTHTHTRVDTISSNVSKRNYNPRAHTNSQNFTICPCAHMSSTREFFLTCLFFSLFNVRE